MPFPTDFSNIPELIEGVSVLGHKEACSSDHFGVNLKIKLNVSLRKTVKRKKCGLEKFKL